MFRKIGQAAFKHHPPIAWAVLAISLVLTWFAVAISDKAVERRMQDRRGFEAQDIAQAIQRRIAEQIQVLRGGVGLFDASDNVSREEFGTYVDTLELGSNYPGMQGYGYAKTVPPSQLQDHVRAMREEGFDDYSIKPVGPRDLYTSIIYLEPFDWRNRRAFGFDMFSEPTRREAMSRARDTGEAAMTKAVTLVQETEEDVQSGFLIYLPVYQLGARLASIEDRRKTLQGFVYSPFRMADLMHGILGASHAQTGISLYDGESAGGGRLLYEEGRESVGLQPFEDHQSLRFAGRTWSLVVATPRAVSHPFFSNESRLIGAGGLLIDILVFLIISSVARQRERVKELAQSMTEELRQESERTRRILDNVSEGIIVTDSQGAIQRMNPAANRVFESAGQNTVATNITEFVPEGLAMLSGHHWDDVEIRETSGRSAQGSELPISVSVSYVPDETSPVWIWVIRDITERKRTEKMQMEFIGVVSHELRTPLTALSGSLGMLRQAGDKMSSEAGDALLSVAHRNAERLRHLVDDILDMEKFKTSSVFYDKAPFDFVALVCEAIDEHQPFAARAEVELELRCDLEQAWVEADTSRIRQVISNLLSNAIKFSSSGRPVVVALSRRRDGIRFAVRNHGSTIPKSQRNRLFESFYQMDSSATRKFSGTGLGLQIVETILKAHDAKAFISSRPDTGTVFFFSLPEQQKLPVRKAEPVLIAAA